jgi:hypothetical protein
LSKADDESMTSVRSKIPRSVLAFHSSFADSFPKFKQGIKCLVAGFRPSHHLEERGQL